MLCTNLFFKWESSFTFIFQLFVIQTAVSASLRILCKRTSVQFLTQLVQDLPLLPVQLLPLGLLSSTPCIEFILGTILSSLPLYYTFTVLWQEIFSIGLREHLIRYLKFYSNSDSYVVNYKFPAIVFSNIPIRWRWHMLYWKCTD